MLLRVLRGMCARDLAALAASCKRFCSPTATLDGASVAEAAARARCLAAGWPRRRVCRTWVTALRLTECAPALPSGKRNDDMRSKMRTTAHALPALALATASAPASVEPPVPGAPCAGCGLLGNSWLNLSTGAVLCGRRQFDGSGGNGCALLHAGAQAVAGGYAPLVVKLGTVRVDWAAEGGAQLRADVYSYAEREAVLHPRLAQHLAVWGVDAAGHGHPPAPSVADLGADVSARHLASVAAWYDVPVAEAPDLLSGMSEDQRAHLMALFVHASRQKFAAARAEAAAAARAGPQQAVPQDEDDEVALLAAQMAAMAAEEAAWDAAEMAAADEDALDHD